jgi:hypothetical protein
MSVGTCESRSGWCAWIDADGEVTCLDEASRKVLAPSGVRLWLNERWATFVRSLGLGVDAGFSRQALEAKG